MAIDHGTSTIAVSTQERTWRVNIETAKGADPLITVFREKISVDATGAVLSRDRTPTASRALSVIAAEVQDFTPSQVGKITGAELATLIALRADMWREQEIAAGPPPSQN